MGGKKIIDLEQGWNHISNGIAKLKNILDGVPEAPIDPDYYSFLYTYPLQRISIPL